MSYPQQVPPGWTKGEVVTTWGTGPRYAIGRSLDFVLIQAPLPAISAEMIITFDSYEDAQAWLKWWRGS